MTTQAPRRRVLFIEDEPALRQHYARQFGARFEVAFAATAAEACVQLREFRPERVVLNTQLADGSGIEVLRRLRARNGVLPVVVTAGHAANADELARSGLPYQHLLVKPFPLDDLAAALDAAG